MLGDLMKEKRAMKYIFVFTILGILVDQITKFLIRFAFQFSSCVNCLKDMVLTGGQIMGLDVIANRGIEIIPNFFYIICVKNTGGAWGLFSNNVLFLTFISLFVLVLLFSFLVKEEKYTKINIAYYSLLFSGIMGNFIDRFFNGYVTDFLNFYLFGYDYPVFNIADICIVLGMMLMVIDLVRGELYAYKMRKRRDTN